jgi:hypothetical protein
VSKIKETTAENLQNSTIIDNPVEETKTELDQDEVSAIFINQSHKQFKQLAYGLADRKKRAVARVLEAVLFEPLEKVDLIGQSEEELFELCQKIMYHKGTVLKYAFERMEKIKKGELNEQEEQ